MSTATMVPVTISPESRAFIDRLGHEAQLDRMIDRARRVVTGLRAIEVVLDEVAEVLTTGVVLWVHRDGIGQGSDAPHRDWIDWMASTFPPDVCLNLTLLSVYHDDGR